jgi:hypothetical protein
MSKRLWGGEGILRGQRGQEVEIDKISKDVE